jgi:RHS repeat-associated protein
MTTTVQLLGTDRAQSVIASIAKKCLRHCYDPFGQTVNRLPANAGFNGTYQESFTAHYMLGNGYRAYSSILRRFLSPDSISPFGKGGLNTYAYCKGDPVNAQDSTGHTPAPPVLPAIAKAQLKVQKSIFKNAPFFEMFSSDLELRLGQLKAYGDQSSEAIGKALFEGGEKVVRIDTRNIKYYASKLDHSALDISALKSIDSFHKLLTTIAKGQRIGQPEILTISNAALIDTPGIPKTMLKESIFGFEPTVAGHLRARELILRHARKKSGGSVKESAWYKTAVTLNDELRKSI